MAKETDKLKMVDIKFADRFLEDLWSMKKTSTTRKSKKGNPWDRFIVTYNNTDMEFEITNVTHCKKMSMGIAKEIYGKEGFDNPREFMSFLNNLGYTDDVYIHDFRMVCQHRKTPRITMMDNANLMKRIAEDMNDITRIRMQISDEQRISKNMEKVGFHATSIHNGKHVYPDKPVRTYGFDTALIMLKNGGRQQREGWNGKGMYIEMQVPDENSKMGRPYLYIKSVNDELVPWVASQTDLLADDWREYEPPKD